MERGCRWAGKAVSHVRGQLSDILLPPPSESGGCGPQGAWGGTGPTAQVREGRVACSPEDPPSAPAWDAGGAWGGPGAPIWTKSLEPGAGGIQEQNQDWGRAHTHAHIHAEGSCFQRVPQVGTMPGALPRNLPCRLGSPPRQDYSSRAWVVPALGQAPPQPPPPAPPTCFP